MAQFRLRDLITLFNYIGIIMNKSINAELKQHLIEYITENYNDDDDDFEGLHHMAFNNDYYIIGYYKAKEWLKSHDIDAFEAIAYVVTQEISELGSCYLKPEDFNSERIVNFLVYFAGYDAIPNVDLSNTSKKELLSLLNE